METKNRPEVGEMNGLMDAQAYHSHRHAQVDGLEDVSWNERGLRITRLRLLSDPEHPVWDVSYCHGILDGRHVDVELPFSTLPKIGMRHAIVHHAKKHGVYAKGLGIFEAISTLC